MLELLSIYKYFEVQLDPSLPYDRHVEQASSAVGMRLNALYWSRRCLSEHNRKQVVQLFLLPIIDYWDVILSTATTVVYHLGLQYNKLCRSILSCDYSTQCCIILNPHIVRDLPCIGISDVSYFDVIVYQAKVQLIFFFVLIYIFQTACEISPMRDGLINKHLFSKNLAFRKKLSVSFGTSAWFPCISGS